MPYELVRRYRQPRTREEMTSDGWLEVGQTGVFIEPGSDRHVYLGEHCCGLSGFGAPGDTCPACEAFAEARRIESQEKP